jgi:hypothetical protein
MRLGPCPGPLAVLLRWPRWNRRRLERSSAHWHCDCTCALCPWALAHMGTHAHGSISGLNHRSHTGRACSRSPDSGIGGTRARLAQHGSLRNGQDHRHRPGHHQQRGGGHGGRPAQGPHQQLGQPHHPLGRRLHRQGRASGGPARETPAGDQPPSNTVYSIKRFMGRRHSEMAPKRRTCPTRSWGSG